MAYIWPLCGRGIMVPMDTGAVEKGSLVSGADVSKWNGKFNFKGLKDAGYSFVIIKSSEGVQYTDPRFRENWKRAKEAGLIVGAYHFARASVIDHKDLDRKLADGKLTRTEYDKARRAGLIQDAEDEAAWFWSVIHSAGGIDETTLPPTLDIEWDKRANAAGITSKETVIWALAFLVKLEELCGVVPIIYTGRNYWRYKLRKSSDFFRYPLWLVQYSKRGRKFGMPAGNPPKPIPGWKQKLWQWSGGGRYKFGTPIPDVGLPDLNWFYGSPGELEAMCGIPTPKKPTPEFAPPELVPENAGAPTEPMDEETPVDGGSDFVPRFPRPVEDQPEAEPEKEPEKSLVETEAPKVPALPDDPHLEPIGLWGRIFAFFAQLLQNKRADTTGKGG